MARYEMGLEGRLIDLHSASIVARTGHNPRVGVHPKADGRQRPLGIGRWRTRLFNRPPATVLNEIYERIQGLLVWVSARRNPHQARCAQCGAAKEAVTGC